MPILLPQSLHQMINLVPSCWSISVTLFRCCAGTVQVGRSETRRPRCHKTGLFCHPFRVGSKTSNLLYVAGHISRDSIRNSPTSPHAMRPLLSSYFNKTCIFSRNFRKKLKYQISRHSIQWELSCSLSTDRWTDRYRGAGKSLHRPGRK